LIGLLVYNFIKAIGLSSLPAEPLGIIMDNELTAALTSKIIALQDENGCWNALHENDKYYPEANYYAPNYRSTLWTLVLLADIQCDAQDPRLARPLKTISDHFLDKQSKIYSLGRSHFPIPCLNGNMLYLHSYFFDDNNPVVAGIIDFFAEYQRFDDGGFRTPSSFPYGSNRSCYGAHTCYWGIVKLLKGLSFLPENKRTANARLLIQKCIDFILLHQVCYSSQDDSQFMHTNIKKLTFPNMYQADLLEILWLLKRENVRSVQMDRAMDLLRSKIRPDSTWRIEQPVRDLVIPIGRGVASEFITARARQVLGD
jgi:hypothetical protein